MGRRATGLILAMLMVVGQGVPAAAGGLMPPRQPIGPTMRSPGPPSRWNDRVERSGWFLAATGIIAFWVTVLTVGFLATPAYSHVDHVLSTLGLADPPFGIIAMAAFVVHGLGTLLLAAYFWRVAEPRGRLALATVVLLAVHGVGRMGFRNKPGTRSRAPTVETTRWRIR